MTEQSEPRPLRLLVVDDHEVVRQGLVALLERRDALPGRRRGRHRRGGARRRPALSAGSRRHGRPPARRLGHRGLPRDPGRAPGHPGRHADELPRRGGRPRGDRRRRQRLPPQADPGPRPRLGPRGRRPRASRCSTRPSPRRSSSGSAGSPPAPTPTSSPQLTPQEQQDPAARRRGQDEQGDRAGGLPVRQDGQELRQLDPLEAQPPAAGPGGGLRRQAPAAGLRNLGRDARRRVGGGQARRAVTSARGPAGSAAPVEAVRLLRPRVAPAPLRRPQQGVDLGPIRPADRHPVEPLHVLDVAARDLAE